MPIYEHLGKRLTDIVVSGTALMFLCPIILAVGAAIHLEDHGPILFRQQRVGRYGRPFTLLKFRSMPVGTGNLPSADARTVRITRIGRFIRRTNIDELPQLINILRGEMSLVGPRPCLPHQTELVQLRKANNSLCCLPGLTGLAQVNSYDGMPDTEKAQWDAQYARGVFFHQDVAVIIRTFAYLIKPPPVY